MDQATLAAFEARASSAEQRLSALEAKLGSGSSSGVDAGAYVAALQELRGLLVTAKEEQERLEGELKEAKDKVKGLETENGKLKYQIKHLKRAVVEGDEKLAALQAKK